MVVDCINFKISNGEFTRTWSFKTLVPPILGSATLAFNIEQRFHTANPLKHVCHLALRENVECELCGFGGDACRLILQTPPLENSATLFWLRGC